MSAKQLARSPFLARSLAFIRENPGCCKADIVGTCPNRTRAYRYAALNRLIRAGFVRNIGRANRYCLYAA